MTSKAESLKRYLEGGGGGGANADTGRGGGGGGEKKKRKRKKDKSGVPEGVKVKKIGTGIMVVDEVRIWATRKITKGNFFTNSNSFPHPLRPRFFPKRQTTHTQMRHSARISYTAIPPLHQNPTL